MGDRAFGRSTPMDRVDRYLCRRGMHDQFRSSAKPYGCLPCDDLRQPIDSKVPQALRLAVRAEAPIGHELLQVGVCDLGQLGR